MLNRAALRARIFRLADEPKDDLRAYTSAAQRLALVADLTRETWALTGREIPAYSRSEMPVAIVPRAKQEE